MNDPRLRRHAMGFLEVADKPSAADLAAYYRNTYFQNEKGNYRAAYPPEELEVIGLRIAQRRARALELLGHDRPGRILDVGCGEGFVLAAFESLGWQVEGIDFSRAGVETMNPAVADRVEDGDLFSILERRIAERQSHDLVWLANVLEHVLEPVDLLELLHRLVKPDGLLVVTVPNDGNAFHDELLESGAIANRFWIAIPDHMSYFTAESLERVAKATGWDCRDIQADFPIDLFLAHEGSNYVRDRSKGPAAHSARLQLERLIGAAGVAAAGRFYSALADVGLGRNITAFLSPRS